MTIEDNEFEIIDRNDETISVTSVEAIDEEFGSGPSFADSIADLSDHNLHMCVEELIRRSIKAARRNIEMLDLGSTNPLQISITTSTLYEGTGYDFAPVKYFFRCYNPSGPDSNAETFDLVLSANTASKRFCEDKRNQPRRLLTSC